MNRVTKKQARWLSEALYQLRLGVDGTFSSAVLPRGVAESLVEEGAMKPIRLVVCDGDESEQWRDGYELTPQGQRLAEALCELEHMGEVDDAD